MKFLPALLLGATATGIVDALHIPSGPEALQHVFGAVEEIKESIVDVGTNELDSLNELVENALRNEQDEEKSWMEIVDDERKWTESEETLPATDWMEELADMGEDMFDDAQDWNEWTLEQDYDDDFAFSDDEEESDFDADYIPPTQPGNWPPDVPTKVPDGVPTEIPPGMPTRVPPGLPTAFPGKPPGMPGKRPGPPGRRPGMPGKGRRPRFGRGRLPHFGFPHFPHFPMCAVPAPCAPPQGPHPCMNLPHGPNGHWRFPDFDKIRKHIPGGIPGFQHGPTHRSGPPHKRPHHGPPRHGPPHHGPPHHGPPHHGRSRPHWGLPPHHPGGGNFSHLTIYQQLEKAKFAQKIFALVKNDTELVKLLNSTETKNITFFCPVDAAFDKIPKHNSSHTPSKEIIRKVILYHLVDGFYPVKRILFSHTLPSLLDAKLIGDSPYRLRTRFGFFAGLRVNVFAKVVVGDVLAKNGIVQPIDTILLPPFPMLPVLEVLPGQFSTLVNALYKTGIAWHIHKHINDTSGSGGTFFAPTNEGFKKLGPKINAFLFSPWGTKYLRALLLYHVAPNVTLYSDKVEDADSATNKYMSEDLNGGPNGPKKNSFPKGHAHIDLRTFLGEKTISVDLKRWGRMIWMRLNGRIPVVFQDFLVREGVVQVPGRVLLPPHPKPHQANTASVDSDEWTIEGFMAEKVQEKIEEQEFDDLDGDMTVEEFKARFEGLLDAGDDITDFNF